MLAQSHPSSGWPFRKSFPDTGFHQVRRVIQVSVRLSRKYLIFPVRKKEKRKEHQASLHTENIISLKKGVLGNTLQDGILTRWYKGPSVCHQEFEVVVFSDQVQYLISFEKKPTCFIQG